MIFALLVVGVVAFVMYNKGYSFERMMPYLLLIGLVAFFVPVGAIIANVIGGVFGVVGGAFGAVGGAFGGIFGGIFGAIGGLIGGLFGLIGGLLGAVFGLVFGIIGLIGFALMIFVPVFIIYVIARIVR